MSYSVAAIPNFMRELKKLGKKHPSLKMDIAQLIESLEEFPQQGVSLGNSCYKIRLAIASKGKGKSGGSRVITYAHIVQKTVYLLSIFDKSDQESIPDKEIKELLEQIPS